MTTGGESPARYMTCPEAAAAAGGGGSSRQQGGRDRSPAGRKLLASGSRGQAGLLSIPESDRDSEVPESSEQESSSSSDEEEEGSSSQEQEQLAAVQDSDCDDEGFTMLGEFPAGTGAAAKAAAASTPVRGGGRHGSQQQRQPAVKRAARRPASAAADTPGAPAGGSGGAEQEEGEWRVLQLPQGSWLRSRGCDTGFTSFFSVTLHQDVWDEAAWRPYLQAGNMLQLRGNIWNVR